MKPASATRAPADRRRKRHGKELAHRLHEYEAGRGSIFACIVAMPKDRSKANVRHNAVPQRQREHLGLRPPKDSCFLDE